jgi:SAM-dependent methyltransferase
MGTMTFGDGSIHDRVQGQYEQYPYPDIDPESEVPRLLVSGHLELMCDVIWGGRKSPEGLRVLDAGCGTGSPLAALAMAYPEADIVGVDFSNASLHKARRLAERYQLKNVRFHRCSLERLPELGLQFDFMTASGVLHHLENPALGLRAMAEVLDPQGVMSIMLYGKYGRIGVQMLQEAIRLALPGEKTGQERISFAYRLAQEIPAHHPFGPRLRGREMQEGKAAGIVDLLLHKNDIPFDVGAIHKLCDDAGVRFLRWLFPALYDPESYVKDSRLIGLTRDLSLWEKYEAAELIHGRNPKHSFFVVRPEFSPPRLDIGNGKWRSLFAWLTPCLAWKRIYPLPGEADQFVVPAAVVQDELNPFVLRQWELVFLSHVQPRQPLGAIIRQPAVRQTLPFGSAEEEDRAVEQLLKRCLDMLALVLLERPR